MKKSLTKAGNMHMTNETSSPRKADQKAKKNNTLKKPKVTLTPIGANKVDER
jgi:hypothetical protein